MRSAWARGRTERALIEELAHQRGPMSREILEENVRLARRSES
jgi:hypothetical protein